MIDATCLCCGKPFKTQPCYRRQGRGKYCSKSCGLIRHGQHASKLNAVWRQMKDRCNREKNARFSDYGGRGIKVCVAWTSFIPFRDWAITAGYREGLEIDRRDNDGNYSPENCRWVTRSQQLSNRRKRPNATSRFRGVCWNKSRRLWEAQLTTGNKNYHLGCFDKESDAAKAFNAAALRIRGEFATLNSIPEATDDEELTAEPYSPHRNGATGQ